MLEEKLTESVIGIFYRVYNELGFGFREYLYRRAFIRELVRAGHQVRIEVPVQVFYRGELLGNERADLVVDERLLVELKAGYFIRADVPFQVQSYLRATKFEVALLLHFGPRPRVKRFLMRTNG